MDVIIYKYEVALQISNISGFFEPMMIRNYPNLEMLERPHVLLLDVEQFWNDLSVSFKHNKNERGRGFGLRWQYSQIEDNSFLMKHIPNLCKSITTNDWTEITFSKTKETVVIIHYATGCILDTDAFPLIDYPWNRLEEDRLKVRCGILAETNLPIARLRLMGDQIIQAAADRREQYEKKK